jgi:hypothetical protein
LHKFPEPFRGAIDHQFRGKLLLLKKGLGLGKVTHILPVMGVAAAAEQASVFFGKPGHHMTVLLASRTDSEGAVVDLQEFAVPRGGFYHFLNVYGKSGVPGMGNPVNPGIGKGGNQGPGVFLPAPGIETNLMETGHNKVQAFAVNRLQVYAALGVHDIGFHSPEKENSLDFLGKDPQIGKMVYMGAPGHTRAVVGQHKAIKSPFMGAPGKVINGRIGMAGNYRMGMGVNANIHISTEYTLLSLGFTIFPSYCTLSSMRSIHGR